MPPDALRQEPPDVQSSAAEDMDVRLIRLNEELRSEIERLTKEIEGLGSQNIELAFSLEEMESGLARVQREADEARAQRDQARLAIQDVEASRIALEGRLESARDEAARRLQELQEAREESTGRLQELEQAREEAERRLHDLEGARMELAAARGETERLVAEVETLQRAREEAETRLRTLQEQARAQEVEARQSIERLQREMEELREAGDQLEQLRQQEEDTRRAREFAERERDGAIRERDAAKAMLGPLEANLTSARRELERLVRDRASKDLEIATMQSRETEQNSQIARLESQIADLRTEARASLTLRAELDEARARIAALEGTLVQVKRELVERPVSSTQAPAKGAGTPHGALTAALAEILGATGKMLVDKVYGRCSVDHDCRDPGPLADVTRMLEETASRLCRSDEQRTRLSTVLQEFRLGLEGVAPGLREATPEAPLAGSPAAAAAPAAAAPRPSGVERPHRLPSPLEPLAATLDETAAGQVAAGMKLLGLEKYEESFDLFTDLAARHPDSVDVQAGLFYNYVGMFCWLEAYGVGRRLVPSLVASGDDRFLTAMRRVLRERLSSTRSMAEKKRLTMELGELLLDKPSEALDQFRRARSIPDPVPEEGRIDFYLLRLLADTRDERLPHLIGALQGVADSLETFDHLEELVQDPKHRSLAPRARTVSALLREGAQAAVAAEDEAPARAEFLEPALLEKAGDPAAAAALAFVLDRLLPRAGVKQAFPSDWVAFEEKGTEWAPATAVWRLDRQVFGLPALTVRQRPSKDGPLVEAFPGPLPTIVLSPAAEGVPEDELRFLVARVMFRLHRRHADLDYLVGTFDGGTRARIVRETVTLVKEAGTEISGTLAGEVASLNGTETPERLVELLDRLYEHCLREEFRVARQLVAETRPFAVLLDREADRFAATVAGLAAANAAVLREVLGDGELARRALQQGFETLYRPPAKETRALRLRLQNLWAWYLTLTR